MCAALAAASQVDRDTQLLEQERQMVANMQQQGRVAHGSVPTGNAAHIIVNPNEEPPKGREKNLVYPFPAEGGGSPVARILPGGVRGGFVPPSPGGGGFRGEVSPGPFGGVSPGPYGGASPGPFAGVSPGPFGGVSPGPFGEVSPGPQDSSAESSIASIDQNIQIPRWEFYSTGNSAPAPIGSFQPVEMPPQPVQIAASPGARGALQSQQYGQPSPGMAYPTPYHDMSRPPPPDVQQQYSIPPLVQHASSYGPQDPYHVDQPSPSQPMSSAMGAGATPHWGDQGVSMTPGERKAREDARSTYARELDEQVRLKKARQAQQKAKDLAEDQRKYDEMMSHQWCSGGGGAPLRDAAGNSVNLL
eukprot:gene10981-12988_t